MLDNRTEAERTGRAFLESQNVSLDTPLTEIRPARLEKLFRGDGKDFPGLVTLLEQEFVTATDRSPPTGTRIVPRPRHLRGLPRRSPPPRSPRGPTSLAKNIAEVCHQSVADARPHSSPTSNSSATTAQIAEPILAEITSRLGFLEKVGLDYLTLDRPSDTLSGGELQRVRLATGIGSGLAGICYILDEPSIGLHPRDNQRLIDALRDLLGRRQHACSSSSTTKP